MARACQRGASGPAITFCFLIPANPAGIDPGLNNNAGRRGFGTGSAPYLLDFRNLHKLEGIFRGKEIPARPKPRGVYSKIPRPLGRGRGLNESLSLALGTIGVCDVNHVHHLRAARLDGLQVGGCVRRISLALS